MPPPLARHSLSLVALQYELALLVGQELRLGPMLRRFMPPALKSLGCRAGHVWLRNDETLQFEHRFAYPSRDAMRWHEDAGLARAVADYAASPCTSRHTPVGGRTHAHFIALNELGFCVLLREGSALDAGMFAALRPIFDRLTTACQASLEHEETERLRAIAADNELRLRTVVETVGEVIFQTDRSGRLSFLNPAWTRIGGMAIDECLGTELVDFFCQADAAEAGTALRDVLAGERQSARFEARLRAPDGSRPWVSVQIRQRAELWHANIGLTGSMVDITEQRRMIDELVAARATAEGANRAKGMFLANMSHEIRTPMNGVIGLTQLALEERLEPDVRGHLEMILASAEHLLTIINDILDFSKIEAGRLDFVPEPFDLHALLEETIVPLRLSAQKKGLALFLHIDGEVPRRVRGDPARLKQVLLNLLGNAVKFTQHGSVALGVEAIGIEGGTSEASGGDITQMLRFSVIDTGIGIAADKQQLIFEAFSQADGSINRAFGGSGLGLTISRRLVQMMGGELHLESDPGKGSEFSFTARFARLPADTPERTTRAPTTPERGGAGLEILVAEDNEVNRRLIRGLLHRLGQRVHFAHDGKAAVAARLAGHYDVILMDMQMPVMDGLSATRQIRALESQHGLAAVPIIALTANAMQGDRERCLAAGMNAYLAKPLRRAELESVLAGIRRYEHDADP